MKYREIINELKMSPRSLGSFAQRAGTEIVAGFEAECFFHELNSSKSEPEDDLDYNQDFSKDITIPDIGRFFDENPYRASKYSPIGKLISGYDDWKQDQITEYIDDRMATRQGELADKYNYDKEEEDHMEPSDFYEEAMDELSTEADDDAETSLYQYLTDEVRITSYYELVDEYGFAWEHQTTGDDDWSLAGGQEVARLLKPIVGNNVEVNANYHGGRSNYQYFVEPDSSLVPDEPADLGVEIISHPMPFVKMISDLEGVIAMIKQHGYTNASSGLHINLSIPNTEIDYTKLILFLGDNHVLQAFDRTANTYTRSSLTKLKTAVYDATKANNIDLGNIFANMSAGYLNRASASIEPARGDKYVSIHMKPTYVEFRSIGGWYSDNWENIKDTVNRFALALKIASDPQAERKEYAKKLYKVLTKAENPEDSEPKSDLTRVINDSQSQDILKVFALYQANLIDKNGLKNILKRRSQERNE